MENSYHCLNYNPSLGKPKDIEVETSKKLILFNQSQHII
jgi:hypothetical protein